MENILRDLDWNVFQRARWFQGKEKRIVMAKVKDYIFQAADEGAILVLPLVEYVYEDNTDELYFIPLLFNTDGSVHEAGTLLEYCTALYELIDNSTTVFGIMGGKFFFKRIQDDIFRAEPISQDSSNTLALIRNDAILKTRRRIFPDINLEEEMLIALNSFDFKTAPVLYGSVNYISKDGTFYNLAILESYIENRVNGWELMKGYFKAFVEDESVFINTKREAEEIGVTIAHMHQALCASLGSEPLLLTDIQGIISVLIKEHKELFGKVKLPSAEEFLTVLSLLKKLIGDLGKKIQIHGDLHLGNLLKLEDGFAIIDFEGQVFQGKERKGKASPLKDVAGMLRSFDYAAWVSFNELKVYLSHSDVQQILNLREKWVREIGLAFLEGYMETVRNFKNRLNPEGEYENEVLLTLFKLEKALYEIRYELSNRPDWVFIPASSLCNIFNELRKLVSL